MTVLDRLTLAQSARALHPGLRALAGWLLDMNYSGHAREAIIVHTAKEGTPTGCPNLDSEDEAAATDAFVEALPPAARWDSAWDRPAVLPTLRAIPPELEDDEDPDEHDTVLLDLWEREHEEALRRLAAAPRLSPPAEEEGYVPTAEDEADYGAWLAELEARQSREYDPAEAPEDFMLAACLRPISGGSPEAQPRFVPTTEDLADYQAAARATEILDALRRDDDARAESDRYRGR